MYTMVMKYNLQFNKKIIHAHTINQFNNNNNNTVHNIHVHVTIFLKKGLLIVDFEIKITLKIPQTRVRCPGCHLFTVY